MSLTPGPSDQGVTSQPGLGSFPSSSGGKERLGSISKQGDRYLRSLFVAGARAVIRYAKIHGTGHRPWLTALLGRRPTKVAAIALANKMARMAWAALLAQPKTTGSTRAKRSNRRIAYKSFLGITYRLTRYWRC